MHLDRKAVCALGKIEELLSAGELGLVEVGEGVFRGEEGFTVVHDVLRLGHDPLVHREEEVGPLPTQAESPIANHHPV